jgi:ubiquinone/menaquinone biosynthesis C-methylase UbiE
MAAYDALATGVRQDCQFACPACGAALEAFACSGCGSAYPAPGGVPWLFADPDTVRAEWRNRYEHARRRLDDERAHTLAALRATASSAPAATRMRLLQLAAGQASAASELGALMEPVLGANPGTMTTPLESHVALRVGLPAAQGLMTYGTNVFRDWAWGDAENAAALAEVRAALGDHNPKRILVLGSGAGRLAYDLHNVLPDATTVALDLNPLLAIAAHRICSGETLALTEFPLAPRRTSDVAVTRHLRAPAPARAGLTFVLGDALRAPFPAGSFDLVVTPWLLDVLDVPVRAAIAAVHRLLAADGAWISHGSVAFAHRNPAERLTADELLDLAATCGFRIGARRERELPYLQCPESRHGRLEEVLTFRADRSGPCPYVADAANPREVPGWLGDADAPIPLLDSFRAQALATRTHAYIMSLIDGQRSRADIARVLERHGLMDEAGARAALAGFLATMYAEATGPRTL